MNRLIAPILLFLKTVLATLVSFPFRTNFRIIVSLAAKNIAGIFIEIVLNFYMNLEIIDIFTMWSSNPWTGYVLQLFFSFQHISPLHVLLNLHLSISFWGIFSTGIVIFNLGLHMFIPSILKYNQLLYVCLVSCELAELAYWFQELVFLFLAGGGGVGRAE